MAYTCKIGVIGLGIAGAASAAQLARAGHVVTVFERAALVGPVGAGLVLQPSGQAALHRMELFDEAVACAEPLSGLDAMLPDGRSLVRLRYAEIGEQTCGYGVHRGELFGVLHDAAVAAGVEICLGTEVTNYCVKDGRLFAVGGENERYGPFDFLIVADGSRSQITARIQPRTSTVEYKYGAIWLLGRNTQIQGRLHQVISGTTRLLGLLPIGGERCTLFWGVRQDAMETMVERGYAAWRDEVLKLCPLAEETLDSAGGFEHAALTSYRHRVPGVTFNQHVICLGDAAHAMSPHLGQGANLALADAVCFADALENSQGFEDACSRYHSARRSTIQYYASLSRILTPFFQSDIGILAWGRDVVLPVMCAVSPMRREMTRAMAGVKQGLFHW